MCAVGRVSYVVGHLGVQRGVLAMMVNFCNASAAGIDCPVTRISLSSDCLLLYIIKESRQKHSVRKDSVHGWLLSRGKI